MAIAHLLATANLKELHVRKDDGAPIDSLYASCSSSGLISKPAADVRQRYEAVFDVALALLPPFLLDFVEEVCGDPALASNDPAEAQLLDGEFVRSWCEKTLAGIEATVVAALKSDALFLQFQARQLHRELAKVSILLAVLQALERIRNVGSAADRGMSSAGASSRRGVDAEMKQAELLRKCFQVMTWCGRHGLHERPHTGRFSSVPDWMRQVHRRRERTPPGRTLFLDDMLQALHIGGAYPFSSLQNMIYMLFITIRDSDAESWNAKLSLLVYYLMDLDFMHAGHQEDFCAAFSVPASEAACWQSMFLLDCVEQPAPMLSPSDAPSSAEAPQLTQACLLLMSQVQGAAPFKVLQVLVELGRADVALTLHWAQAGGAARGPGGSDDLLHAQTLLDLRLRCGLLVEAFLEMRAHCRSLPPGSPALAEHTRVLVTRLAEWAAAKTAAQAAAAGTAAVAAARSPLQTLCELPWSSAEEDVLVGWLYLQLQAGRPAGDALPLYFLSRGQVPETLGAYNQWALRKQGQPAADRGGDEGRHAVVDAAVNAAAAMLPLPARNVCVAPAATGDEPCWPARLLAGLALQEGSVPIMSVSLHGPSGGGGPGGAPPFLWSRLPAQSEPSPQPSQQDQQPAGSAAVGNGTTTGLLGSMPAAQPDHSNGLPEAQQPEGLFSALPPFALPFASARPSSLFQPSAEPPPGGMGLFGPARTSVGHDPRDPKRARTGFGV